MLSIEMLQKEDIDLVDKLSNMADSEISEYVCFLANLPENFDRITDKVWELLRDETSPYSNLEYFKGLANEYEAVDEHDLWTACLYNCDLIYMQAIASVLGLPIPQSSCDFLET